MRKQYSATFKAEMVREILKEEKTLSQLASESGVHPTQLKEWKKMALNGLPELFNPKGQTVDKLAQQHEQQVEALYAEIGRLTTQVNCAQRAPENKSGLQPDGK
jgi:transposase-like protein